MFPRFVIILLLFQLLLFQVQLNAQNNTATLSGSIEGAQEGDTVRVIVWDELIDFRMRYATRYREFSSVITDGKFVITVTAVGEPKYFSLGLTKEKFQGQMHELLSMFIMQPNDNVRMIFALSKIKNRVASGDGNFDSNKYKTSFSGFGAEKYNLAFRLKSETSSLSFLNKVNFDEANKFFRNNNEYGHAEYQLNLWNNLKNEADDVAKSYQGKISAKILKLLQNDCAAWIERKKLYTYYRLAVSLQFSDSTRKARRILELNNLYDRYCTSVAFNTSDTFLWISPYLIEYVNYKIINDQIRNNSNAHYSGVYEFIKSNYIGEFRDRLILSNYFTANGVDYFLSPDKQAIVKDMLNTISNYNYYAFLQDHVNNSTLGKPIKNFSLPDADGKYISIADLKGKVVFIDLWYSGCGSCAAYYKSVLSNVERQYKDRPNVVFITISIDSSRELWLKGLKGGAYTGDHAINLYTDGMGTQHPFIKHYNITGYPSPFLINKDGILIQRGSVALGSIEGLTQEIEAALAKPMVSAASPHTSERTK